MTDSKTFKKSCQLSAKDPVACVKRLGRLAKRNIEALVEIAGILMKEHVGIIQSTPRILVAAIQLLDIVLEINSDHIDALSMKGKMLMARHFFGTEYPDTLYLTLELV